MFLQSLACSEIHKQIWQENEYIRNVSYIENISFGIVLWNSCGICICIYARCLPSFAAHLRIGRLPKNFQPPQLRLQNMFRSIWPSPVKIYCQDTSFSFGKKNIQFSLCVYRTTSHPETGLSWSHSPQMNCFLFQCKFVIIFPSRVLMDESFDIKETVHLPSILGIFLLFHQLRSTATWGRKNKQESNCRGRVRKSKNFPDSKIFVAKTFQMMCVNCVNFQIWDICPEGVLLQDLKHKNGQNMPHVVHL